MSIRIRNAPLAVLAAAILGVFLTTGMALASTPATSSATPSATTPYCAVVISGTTAGAEHCYSSHSAMTAAVPAASTVTSVDYVNANYQGASLTWYASGIISCSGFPDYVAPSMPSGWNDVVSSYRDYANCSNNPHYENNNYGGAVVNCGPNCGYVGAAMNDKTSSEKWGS